MTANLSSFFVYQDQDAGFNHGFPSGFFGDIGAITIDTGCVDNPADTTTGCFPSTDTTALDTTRGTVFRFTLAPLSGTAFAGVNIEEPQDWGVLNAQGQCGVTTTCNPYDLPGATSVTFNGTAATFTVISKSLITTTVPTGATTGRVQVTTPTRTLKSNVAFRVTQ